MVFIVVLIMAKRAHLHLSKDRKNGGWVIDGLRVEGKRKRRYFAKKSDAELELASLRAQQAREGEAAFDLPAAIRMQAAKASEILRPHGANLVDAARFYVKHLEATKRSLPFSVLVEKLLHAKEADGRSVFHLRDMRWRLRLFGRNFDDKLVEEITTLEINEWLRAQRSSPQSRNNFRKVLHGAFSFAESNGFCSANPVAKAATAKVIKGPPSVLSPLQMRSLLANAASEIIPYIAIAGFAGLRNSEVEALDWDAVDLARNRIEVKAVHKTGHRWVDIQPNLALWITPHRKAAGPVSPKDAIRLRATAAKLAKISWQNNVLRHTYGSSHAVHFRNATLTSNQMGNTPRVLLEHYRNLITPEAAADWWGIVPEESGQNIFRLGAVNG